MKISDYQINAILRACSDNLRRSSVSTRPKHMESCSADTNGISSMAMRTLIIDEIASNIVDKISRHAAHKDIGKDMLGALENESDGQLTVAQESSFELIFKEIDDHGERIRSLSFDNPKSLRKESS